MADEKKENTPDIPEKEPETVQNQADAAAEQAKKKKVSETYSVPLYVTIMFAVFIVLIMLSYMISQRNSKEVISNLSTEHSRVQAQALENIEQMQNKNLELTAKVGEYEERIETLEAEAAALTRRAEEAEKARDKLQSVQEKLSEQEKKASALRALFEYEQALQDGTDAQITSTSTKVEAQKAWLDAEALDYYISLKAGR